VVREVLAIRPELPTLLITGYSGKCTPESLRALGVRAVVLKPMTSFELATAVRQALDGRGPGG
jgi:DNA-binding NarL/FixJ family response regulator